MLVNMRNLKILPTYAVKNPNAQSAYTDCMNTREMGLRVLLSRRDLGMEQWELAERAATSQSYISRLEHGKAKTISVEIIHSIASALGVSASYLIGDTDDPLANVEDSQPDTYVKSTDPYIQDMVDMMQRWDDDQRRLFVEWMRTISRPPG